MTNFRKFDAAVFFIAVVFLVANDFRHASGQSTPDIISPAFFSGQPDGTSFFRPAGQDPKTLFTHQISAHQISAHQISVHRNRANQIHPQASVIEETCLPNTNLEVKKDPNRLQPAVQQAAKNRFHNGIFSAWHLPVEHKNTGFLDFNTYWDTRDFSVFTINAGAKLPCDFEYFQFINFTSPLGDASELEDWNDFFTEIHFRRPIAKDHLWLKHLDWNLMWADGGIPNEVGRFGVRWRWQDTPGGLGRVVKDVLKLKFSTTFHVLEDDGSGWQIEHVYRRNFLDGLVYVGGFADHNINSASGNSDWVAECQAGLKLYGNCFAVVEHRYNSFLPARFRSGWGIGLEYAVPFR